MTGLRRLSGFTGGTPGVRAWLRASARMNAPVRPGFALVAGVAMLITAFAGS